jgi:CubicO group peptidase (beta-lactamase class C family)
MNYLLVLFLLLFVPLSGGSLETLTTELTSLQKKGLLGGEVLIAKGDKVLLHLESQEVAKMRENGEPQFMIGSCSKQFFAAALLKALYESNFAPTEKARTLEVEKLLYLPIKKFLPAKSAIWAGNMPEWANLVTLHQLLTHTAGIIDIFDTEEYEYSNLSERKRKFFEFPHSPAELIAILSNYDLLFEPGSKFSYSNSGYLLIALIIEEITHTKVTSYLDETIFLPLKLQKTANPNSGNSKSLSLEPRQAHLMPELHFSPKRRLSNPRHLEDISNAIGSGSIITTAQDFLKWNLALHKDKSVLPEPLYKLFITPDLEDYAYGLWVSDSIFGHDGRIGTYSTQLLYLPKEELSIIVLTNIDYGENSPRRGFQAITELVAEYLD